jgi:hypothetical protein
MMPELPERGKAALPTSSWPTSPLYRAGVPAGLIVADVCLGHSRRTEEPQASLPQLQNRLRVETQWLWSYLTGQRRSHLISKAPRAVIK